MTGWFDPRLLSKLLLRVIVSDLFGQYADRRLVHAALDTVGADELRKRADLTKDVERDKDGAIWIDYVADLGDGFDATYAIAYLLAQKELIVDGHRLPRGSVLVMGGDEVYPTAARDDYSVKLRKPYNFAFPNTNQNPHPPVLLLPGNHDWYDGLVNFLAIFCRQKSTPIGAWRTRQRRSYFAAKLNDNWWVWCIDIALVRDMDQPQADYFVAIAEAMSENSSIILCSAEPGWYSAESNGDSYRTLSYASWLAQNANKNLRIPLVLSGDSHHYARYSGPNTQYITSGGGGAFVHGTLELKDEIEADWLKDRAKLSLRTAATADHATCGKEACYPSKNESRKMLNGNWLFVARNPAFSFFLGTVFAVFAFAISSWPRWDVVLLVYLTLFGGFVGYTGYQEGFSRKIFALSFVHTLAQFGVVGFFAFLVLNVASVLAPTEAWHWLPWLVLSIALTAPFGGVLAGTIFGLNLLVTCRFFNINHNDAFSAMKLDSYRHFLRIRIAGDRLDVYPIALDRVPRRWEWQENPARQRDPSASVFIPPEDFSGPHLIEGPIVIQTGHGQTTEKIRPPADLPSPP